jgi:hypothetical protein
VTFTHDEPKPDQRMMNGRPTLDDSLAKLISAVDLARSWANQSGHGDIT